MDHQSISIRASDQIIIDDVSSFECNGSTWSLFTDRVMGGVSQGILMREMVCGRSALRMRGLVSFENNGGFVQMARDLAPGGGAIDASAFIGVEIDVRAMARATVVICERRRHTGPGSPIGTVSRPRRHGPRYVCRLQSS